MQLKLLLITAMSVASSHVGAQTAPASAAPVSTAVEESASLEEIVVTARKIGERLQDVPLSIRALTGKDLQELGVTSLSELSQFTPGLSYSPDFGRTGERPVIRGISTNRNDAPQPVSVFVNGVYVRDAALGLVLDDVQRVEVIKGPQSALYGRSTYAGAINYITVKPENELTGKVSATVAGQGGEKSLFGAITLPILPSVLSARLRARNYEYGGQYTNSQTGNKIGNERTKSGGGELSFTPSKTFDALFSLDYSVDRDGLFAAAVRTIPTQAGGVVTNQNGSSNAANGTSCDGHVINIVGNNPATGLPDPAFPASLTTRTNGWPCGASTFSGRTVRLNETDFVNYTDPKTGINYGNIAGLDRNVLRGSATLNYHFGGGYTLTSQSAYTRQKSNLGADQSYNGTRFAPGFGFPASSWLTYDRDRLNYLSQELRLMSPQDAALTWLIGAFYYKENGHGETSGVIAQNATLQTIADPLRPKPESSVRSLSPFGRVQYTMSETIKLSAEGRFGNERVQIGGPALGTAIVSVGTCTAGQLCYVSGSKTFRDFAPRFTFDYKPYKDVLFYAQLAKGSKSGGFNTTPGLAASDFAYDGEKVTSGELGAKSEFANRSIRFNFALFQNNLSGLQLSNVSSVQNPFTGAITSTTVVNNVGKARTRGLEAELVVKANRWLTLSGNYAFTDAKALEGTEITNGTVFGGNRSVAGFTLPRSPRHSVAGSAAIDVPAGSADLRVFARADMVYQSRRYAEIQNLIWADPFTHINASAGVHGNDWRATIFVKNAADDDTALNGFRYLDPATFRRTAVDFLPRLRQYGITLLYEF